MAAPAFGTSRGTAWARWSPDGAHSCSLLIMLKYKYFSSRGTSRGTAFPAGARAPAGPGVAPPMVVRLFIHLVRLCGIISATAVPRLRSMTSCHFVNDRVNERTVVDAGRWHVRCKGWIWA